MGQIRFLAPRPERVPKDAIARAYMAGMEQVPWQCRNRWVDNQIVVEREIEESGNLFIPWRVEGHGEIILSTTSLMERTEPYHLPVELARGTINRIRNQLAIWQPQGFVISDRVTKSLKAATATFIRAATTQSDLAKSSDEAEQALVQALDTIALLSKDFTAQVLTLRHQQTPKLPTLLVGQIDAESLAEPQSAKFLAAFNAAAVPFNWRDVELNEGEYDWSHLDKQMEWCRSKGLKICGGPLLRLYQGSLPDWTYLWEDDFDTIRSYALQYVESVVNRYRGAVHIWHVCAGMNTTGTLVLPEEFKLRLTVDAIQAVTQADSRAPVIVSVNQPWAEYLAKEDLDLSPIHFADALVRADLGVAGIGLEINLAYWPGGTLPRELLEINRLLDHWSHLGLPLLILITIPSHDEADPKARRSAQSLADAFPNGLTPRSQAELAQKLVRLIVSKQCVHAVIWNQLSDATPHDFPHGGLFDSRQNPKPVLDVLARFRQKHLA